MTDEEIMMLEGIEEKRERWSQYTCNGIKVPRVSAILSATIGKPYLERWAANLGSNYDIEKKKILATGTLAHEMIEDFLMIGHIRDQYNIPNSNLLKAMNCYHNFVIWWNHMKDNGFIIKPLFIEKQLVCPLYGGTCDLIAAITNPYNHITKNYILDFKSSKAISPDYFIQTVLYMKAVDYQRSIDNLELPEISGVGIIRVDKEKQNNYEFLLADKGTDFTFLNNISTYADNMVYWFYQYQSIEYQYKQFKKNFKNGKDV